MSARTNDLARLAEHWMCDLPRSFMRLYTAIEYPYAHPCEFLPLDEMICDSERWRGMLPQFMPFGHDRDENFFGFYAQFGSSPSEFAVLYWDHEYDHYRPVASSFTAFLKWCIVVGRSEAHDECEAPAGVGATSDDDRLDFARAVGVPDLVVDCPAPRNEREMHEQMCAHDPQACEPLCQLGCRHLAHGNVERARDFFARASEAAPWFADPYYLMAETYLAGGAVRQAMERYRRVMECAIALSTRTGLYDVGAGRDDSEVSEEAARACRSYNGPAEDDELSRFVRERSDAFESPARLDLGRVLEQRRDFAGAEREYLNAVTLATVSVDMEAAYARLTDYYDKRGRERDAALCRRDSRRTD